MADNIAETLRLEKLAEASYAAMYDARPASAKSHYEDALAYLERAIVESRLFGDEVTTERLMTRRNHIRAVYDHQFRGVG